MIVFILLFGSIYYLTLITIRFIILDHLNVRLQIQSLIQVISLFIIAITSLILTATLSRYLFKHNH